VRSACNRRRPTTLDRDASTGSGADCQVIDHVAHAEDEPSIVLCRGEFGRGPHCAGERHAPIPRADANAGGMDGRIPIENHPHGVADKLVAVLFGRLDIKAVGDITSSGTPPGEDPREPFLGEARHLAGERDDAAHDSYVDPPDVRQRRMHKLKPVSDVLADRAAR